MSVLLTLYCWLETTERSCACYAVIGHWAVTSWANPGVGRCSGKQVGFIATQPDIEFKPFCFVCRLQLQGRFPFTRLALSLLLSRRWQLTVVNFYVPICLM